MQSIKVSDLSFAVAPAETLLEELAAREENAQDLSRLTGIPLSEVEEILVATRPITEPIAVALAKHFGTSTSLWLNLERQYQEARAAELPVLSEASVRDRQNGPNGRVALRIPKSLHGRVVDVAAAEGVSMNQLLVALITEGVVRHEETGRRSK